MKIIFILAILLLVYAAAGNAANFPMKDVALIHYATDSFRPQWIMNGTFAEVLQRDSQEHQLIHFTSPKNVVVYRSQDKLRKKMTIAFSPKVMVKPVIIVEQLQGLFSAYQAQKHENIVSADGNGPKDGSAQAKTQSPDDAASSRPSADAGNFLFSPYYHRVYGIHLQILW